MVLMGLFFWGWMIFIYLLLPVIFRTNGKGKRRLVPALYPGNRKVVVLKGLMFFWGL